MHDATGIQRPVASGPQGRAWGVAAASVVVVGVAVRILAARGDLWLDEIWSIVLAREAGTVARVFGAIHHDNNHYLNTLWMLILGDARSSLLCRLPSLAASAGTLLLVASRRSDFEGSGRLTMAVLLASCPFLVQYDSEARGYAPAAFFAVAGFFALGAMLKRGGWTNAAILAGCATLGILSHLTYAFALAGFVAWAALELARPRGPRLKIAATAAAFVPPLISLAALWAVDLRPMTIGGGPAYSIPGVLRDLAAGTVSIPFGPPEIGALLVLVPAASALVMIAKERDSRAAFFVVALLIAPAVMLSVRRPAFLAARYFFVLVPFVLILAGMGLTALGRRGRWGRIAQGVVLATFVAASVPPNARLVSLGRGDYAGAVAFMRAGTPENVVTVGTDSDFRNGMVLSYYAEADDGAKPFEVVPRERWRERPPRWFLIHEFMGRPAASAIALWTDVPYFHAATFPRAGLSGWDWQVFRRAGDEAR